MPDQTRTRGGDACCPPLNEVGGVVEGVGRLEQQTISVFRPTRIAGITVGDGADLAAGQIDAFREERDVHTPLVLTPTSRTGPTDDDLSVPHGQREPLAELVPAPPTHRR